MTTRKFYPTIHATLPAGEEVHAALAEADARVIATKKFARNDHRGQDAWMNIMASRHSCEFTMSMAAGTLAISACRVSHLEAWKLLFGKSGK